MLWSAVKAAVLGLPPEATPSVICRGPLIPTHLFWGPSKLMAWSPCTLPVPAPGLMELQAEKEVGLALC